MKYPLQEKATIGYEEAVHADVKTQAQYVIQGLIDNAKVNDALISSWPDAGVAMDVYLAHARVANPVKIYKIVSAWMILAIAAEQQDADKSAQETSMNTLDRTNGTARAKFAVYIQTEPNRPAVFSGFCRTKRHACAVADGALGRGLQSVVHRVAPGALAPEQQVIWFQRGQLHRLDGPAVEWADSAKA